MTTAPKTLPLLLLAAVGAPVSELWAMDNYRRIAQELSVIAQRSAAHKIAVLPFRQVGGAGSGGETVSERLVSQLVQEGRVQVVERSQLDRVLGEQRLGATGALEDAQVQQLGHIMGVDAVVTGSIISVQGGKAELNARLIHAGDARVLGAAVAQVVRDWVAPDVWNLGPGINVPPPSIAMDFKPWWDGRGSPGGVSNSDSRCEELGRRLYEVQKANIDIKARFWSARLRQGLDGGVLAKNPGTEIVNLQLKSEFYNVLKSFFDSGAVLPPSEEELRNVLSEERDILEGYERCAR
jgi:TolB-like protein